jgi:hypothetical protein
LERSRQNGHPPIETVERLAKNAKIPFDELRMSGKILSKWISNRSG